MGKRQSRKVQLLVVGDTHIGRTTHPRTGVSINRLNAFATAVEYGIKQDVDAVAHVGDLFHESATPSQAALVQKKIFAELADADIPFYYVRGNHATQSSDELFSMVNTDYLNQLNTTGVAIGSTVRLFGINHSPGGNLPWSEFAFPYMISEPVSILILHQTLQQLSGAGPMSVDLDRIFQQFGGQFDAVFSGHHHDATRQDYNGVPLLYTGAAEHMSKNENPVDRIAWMVQVENESVSIDRYDIPE
nr:metallophosphoesterase [Natronomonas aquatica]